MTNKIGDYTIERDVDRYSVRYTDYIIGLIYIDRCNHHIDEWFSPKPKPIYDICFISYSLNHDDFIKQIKDLFVKAIPTQYDTKHTTLDQVRLIIDNHLNKLEKLQILW